MSGIYNGVQAKVLNDNPRALSIPCMACMNPACSQLPSSALCRNCMCFYHPPLRDGTSSEKN